MNGSSLPPLHCNVERPTLRTLTHRLEVQDFVSFRGEGALEEAASTVAGQQPALWAPRHTEQSANSQESSAT